MKTRIDHTTVVTCRESGVVVLGDTSVAFEGGVIAQVGPTRELAAPSSAVIGSSLPIAELKGRPLGTILVRLGVVSSEQIAAALDRQKTTHGVIGQTLLDLGYVTEAMLERALAIQAGREPPIAPETDDTAVVDGRHSLVIPGLVNTHHHLFQSLTRCMPTVQQASLFDWLTTLYPLWRELSFDALRQAATISLAELLLNGCTTTSDHHYMFPADRDVKIEAVLEAAESLGIRIHACRGSMSLGQSAGGLPPDACVQAEEDILADCQYVLNRFHDPKPMAMRRIDLAPCAPFSVTSELLDETRVLASEHKALLHTHVAETLDEQRFCLERFGKRPIAYLHDHQWLGDNVYLAHCVQLNEAEITLLAETRTGVVHCPSSNMRLASGIAPVRRMLDADVRVALGVDGSSSNDGSNLLSEARLAVLLQRVGGDAKGLSTAEAFRMATAGGADCLHRPELGRIEPGAAADLVMFDTDDVAFAGAIAQDPLGALMLAQPPRPKRVYVAGKPTVLAGRIPGIDWPKLTADFNQMVRERFR